MEPTLGFGRGQLQNQHSNNSPGSTYPMQMRNQGNPGQQYDPYRYQAQSTVRALPAYGDVAPMPPTFPPPGCFTGFYQVPPNSTRTHPFGVGYHMPSEASSRPDSAGYAGLYSSTGYNNASAQSCWEAEIPDRPRLLVKKPLAMNTHYAFKRDTSFPDLDVVPKRARPDRETVAVMNIDENYGGLSGMLVIQLTARLPCTACAMSPNEATLCGCSIPIQPHPALRYRCSDRKEENITLPRRNDDNIHWEAIKHERETVAALIRLVGEENHPFVTADGVLLLPILPAKDINLIKQNIVCLDTTDRSTVNKCYLGAQAILLDNQETLHYSTRWFSHEIHNHEPIGPAKSRSIVVHQFGIGTTLDGENLLIPVEMPKSATSLEVEMKRTAGIYAGAATHEHVNPSILENVCLLSIPVKEAAQKLGSNNLTLKVNGEFVFRGRMESHEVPVHLLQQGTTYTEPVFHAGPANPPKDYGVRDGGADYAYPVHLPTQSAYSTYMPFSILSELRYGGPEFRTYDPQKPPIPTSPLPPPPFPAGSLGDKSSYSGGIFPCQNCTENTHCMDEKTNALMELMMSLKQTFKLWELDCCCHRQQSEADTTELVNPETDGEMQSSDNIEDHVYASIDGDAEGDHLSQSDQIQDQGEPAREEEGQDNHRYGWIRAILLKLAHFIIAVCGEEQ